MKAEVTDVFCVGYLKNIQPGAVGRSSGWPIVTGQVDEDGWCAVYRVEFSVHPSTHGRIMSFEQMEQRAVAEVEERKL